MNQNSVNQNSVNQNSVNQNATDLLLKTFTDKYVLAEGEVNEYTQLQNPVASEVSGFLPVRVRTVRRKIRELNADKATGPDGISACLLKE